MIMKHLLSIEQLSVAEIAEVFKLSQQLKASRRKTLKDLPLKNQVWALIFNKSSSANVSFAISLTV